MVKGHALSYYLKKLRMRLERVKTEMRIRSIADFMAVIDLCIWGLIM